MVRGSTILLILLVSLTFVSAEFVWYNPMTWFGSQDESFSIVSEPSDTFEVIKIGERWSNTIRTGAEGNLTFWTTNSSDKKTHIGWLAPNNSCTGWTDKFLYDEQGNRIQDDKNKDISLKCETAKCDGLNCYSLALTDAQSININDYIKLGEANSVIEYQNVSQLVYKTPYYEVNYTVLEGDKNRQNYGINYGDLEVVNQGELKWAIIFYNSTGNREGLSVYESNVSFKKDAQGYYLEGEIINNGITTEIKRDYVQVPDVCYDTEDFSSNCVYELSNDDKTLSIQFTAEYKGNSTIWIDPTYTINVFTTSNSAFSNMTQENNYSHLNISDSAVVAHWDFNANFSKYNNVIYDLSDNNLDLTLFLGDGEFRHNTTNCQFGNCLFSNRTVDEHFRTPAMNSTLPYTKGQPFTVHFTGQVRNTSVNDQAFWAFGSGEMYARTQTTGAVRICDITAVGACTNSNTGHDFSQPFSFTLSYDGTIYTMYYNGVYDINRTGGADLANVSDPVFYLGTSGVFGTFKFGGNIDDLIILDEYVNAQGALALHNRTRNIFYDTGIQTFNVSNSEGNNTINVSIAEVMEFNNSYVQVWAGNLSDVGSEVWQNVTSGENYTFSFDASIPNITVEVRAVSGNGTSRSFTPEIFAGMTFNVFGIESGDTTAPNLSVANITVLNGSAIAAQFNATDDTAVDTFFINDTTNFQINSTGYFQNNTVLSVGNYTVNVSVNDTSGNINWSVILVRVIADPEIDGIFADVQLSVACLGNYSITLRDCSGSSGFAYPTIQGAVDVQNPGDTVYVRGGDYYENITITTGGNSTHRKIIQNYPDERPTIFGTQQLTGWEQCTNTTCEDLRYVNGTLNPYYEQIYKVNISAADIPDITDILLIEDGVALPVSQFPDNTDLIYNDESYFITLTDSRNWGSQTALYDPSTLTQDDGFWNNSFVRLRVLAVANNQIIQRNVTGFNQSENRLDIADTGSPGLANATDTNDSYSIINHPYALDRQGEYFYTINPIDGNITMYLWPNDNSSLDTTTSFSVKEYGFFLSTGVSYVTIDGFDINGLSSDGTYSGGITGPTVGNIHHMIIQNNNIKNIKGYGGIKVFSWNDSLILDNNISDISEGRGIPVNAAYNISIWRNNINKTEQTGIYFGFSYNNTLINNTIGEAGIHGNGVAIYQGSSHFLVAGNKFIKSNSALTSNPTSDYIYVINNILDGNASNIFSFWNLDNSYVYAFNNFVKGTNPGGDALYLNLTDPTNVVKNNILSGRSNVVGANVSHNLYIDEAESQTYNNTYFEFVEENISKVITNYTATDFTLFNGSVAVDNGTNITYYLQLIEAEFPGIYDYYSDIDGNPRPDGLTWDIGPYELQGSTAVDDRAPFLDTYDITVTDVDPVSADFNASDVIGIDQFFINDTTNFAIDNSGLLSNNTVLSIGTYSVNISVNDTSGNINSSIITVTVNDVPPPFITVYAFNSTNTITENVTFEQNYSHLSILDDERIVDYTFDVNFTEFGGVVNDNTEYDHDTTTLSNVQWTNTDMKNGEGAVTINAAAALIRTDNITNHIPLVAAQPFTIGGWYKSNNPGGADQGLFAMSSAANGWYSRIQSSGVIRMCGLLASGSCTNTANTYNWSNWHHVIITYDGTTYSVYIDGAFDKNVTATADLGNLDTTYPYAYFGTISRLSSSPWNGSIDDIFLMNTSLNAVDAAAIYGDTANKFYATGVQKNYFTIGAGNSSVNVSVGTIQEYNNSYLQVWAGNVSDEGSATFVNISSDSSYLFSIDTAVTNVSVMFRHVAGNTTSMVSPFLILPYTVYIPEGNDTTAPTLEVYNITSDNETAIAADFNASDGSGIDVFFINDTTNFKINSSNGLFENNTVLNVGLYWVNVSVNDTLGNLASQIIYVNITAVSGPVDTIAPQFGEPIPTSDTITYGTDWSGADFDATDDVSIDTWFTNDTRFTINSTGFLDDAATLGAGTYSINVSVNDTSNNINSTTYTLTVNKATPVLLLDETNTTYPTSAYVNASESNSVDDDAIYRLWVDGVNVQNGSDIDYNFYNAGTYTIVYNVSESANFTSSTNTTQVLLSQSTSSCDVLFNESSPLVYPNTFTAYSNCDSSFTLYRNGSIISNNSEQALSAGTYNFTVIRDDTGNYTNTADTEVFTITADNPPVLTNIENKTLFANTSFSFSINATDDYGLDVFTINDTSVFTINATTGLMTNNTPLINVSIYWINVSINDTIGQVDSEVFFINVTQPATSTCGGSYNTISLAGSRPYGRLCYAQSF